MTVALWYGHVFKEGLNFLGYSSDFIVMSVIMPITPLLFPYWYFFQELTFLPVSKQAWLKHRLKTDCRARHNVTAVQHVIITLLLLKERDGWGGHSSVAASNKSEARSL